MVRSKGRRYDRGEVLARYHTLSVTARRLATILVGLSVASLALLALRMLIQGDGTYGFLAWNLLLAWIPLLFALGVVAAWRLERRVSLALLVVLWLLFFPNAPYVLTDFVHLGRIGGMPRWFDVLLLGGFAAASLAPGFVSLHLIQSLIRSTWGVAWSWAGALGAIALSGVGIYLGRVYQLNSWDVLQPGRLLRAFARGSSAEAHAVVLTLLLTCLLAAAYALAQQFAERQARSPR